MQNSRQPRILIALYVRGKRRALPYNAPFPSIGLNAIHGAD
jgi:hypothetical protein